MKSCVERRFRCESGEVLVVLCRPPVDPLQAVGEKAKVFRWVTPGSLSVEYADDWSKGFFAYVVPGAGGGFYMEADLDALDDPGCGEQVVPWIVGELSGWHPDPRGLEMLRLILGLKVFRGSA